MSSNYNQTILAELLRLLTKRAKLYLKGEHKIVGNATLIKFWNKASSKYLQE